VSIPQDDGHCTASLAGFVEGEGGFSCVKTSASYFALKITFQSTATEKAILARKNIGGHAIIVMQESLPPYGTTPD